MLNTKLLDEISARFSQLAAITRHLVRRAAAFAVWMTEITAGTGVHRRGQLKAGRELDALRGARDADDAVFQRFAQSFEHASLELRQFVKEQHAVMRE